MATRSVVGYLNETDEFRGTYVHYDGYPEDIIPHLTERMAKVGYDGLVEWVENGISGQGYRSADADEPYNDGDDVWLKKVNDEEYGYTVHPDGRIEVYDS